MKIIIVLSVLMFSASVNAAEPCTEQNYSDPDRAPSWSCPGPGESILLPEIKFYPSIGLDVGSSYQKLGGPKIELVYPAVLLDKNKVIQLGLRIQGLRRLRWLDLHKGASVLKIEQKYSESKFQAKLDLEKSRSASYKSQRDDARAQRDELGKWYRSWTCGFIVGVIVVSTVIVVITYASG